MGFSKQEYWSGVPSPSPKVCKALIKLARVGHSPSAFWCLCQEVSLSFFTLIKLCYTKALKCSSLVPCSEAKSSFSGDHESDIIHHKLSVAQMVKNLPATQEMQVRFLDWEGPLEKGMAIHSSMLAQRIQWTDADYSPWCPSAGKISSTSNVRVYPQFNFKNGCVHFVIMLMMEWTFTERLLYDRQHLHCFTGINCPMR